MHRSPDCWSSPRHTGLSLEEPDSPSEDDSWTPDPPSASGSTPLKTAESTCECVFVSCFSDGCNNTHLTILKQSQSTVKMLCFRLCVCRRSSEVIGCVMPPAALAENVSVCVVYDGRPCLSTSPSFTFTYEKNPTISQITPSKSFLRYDTLQDRSSADHCQVCETGGKLCWMSYPLHSLH